MMITFTEILHRMEDFCVHLVSKKDLFKKALDKKALCKKALCKKALAQDGGFLCPSGK